MNYLTGTLVVCAAAVALAGATAFVSAAPIQVTIDTSALTGQTENLAFDLLDGGPPANRVTISGFVSDGSLGAASTSGDVSGSFPGSVTLSDTSFFSEYVQSVTFGSSLTFTFDTTGQVADLGSFPDAFSLFILDPTSGLPLFSTSDPTGADALLLFNMGEPSPLSIYTSQSVNVTAGPVTNGVPEPGVIALVISGLVALAVALAVRKYRLRPQSIA